APKDEQAQLDAVVLAAGNVTLALEAITTRSGAWDGLATLTLEVRRDGEKLTTDAVQLRCAPTLLPDNTQPAERLYVMRLPQGPTDDLAFYEALVDHLPEAVELYTGDHDDYRDDRWVQDSMQPAYQQRPLSKGERRTLPIYLQGERPTGRFGLE